MCAHTHKHARYNALARKPLDTCESLLHAHIRNHCSTHTHMHTMHTNTHRREQAGPRELAYVPANRHLHTQCRVDTHTRIWYTYVCLVHVDASYIHAGRHTKCRAGTRSHAARHTHLPTHRHTQTHTDTHTYPCRRKRADEHMRILSRTHQHAHVLHDSPSRSRTHTYSRARSTLGQPESVLKHLDQKHLATPTHYKMLREKDDEGGREGQQGGREGVRRRGRDGGKGGGCRGRLQGGMPGGREAGGGQGDRVTQGGRHGGRQGGGGYRRVSMMLVVTVCQSVATKRVCCLGAGACSGGHQCLCIHADSFS